ncbi:hypothetical protein B296_00023150 [Ensete ventricosum]|uniref:Uncharacterized protein n=1 Tax=Ensete ventricosum TaxID=4639 RepID=A0A426X7F4_ENSVE|nr:hypothetical protein B296_00023150 [Ensete ventricosum]
MCRSAFASSSTQLSSGNYVYVNVDGGGRNDVYGEDGGRFVTDLLDVETLLLLENCIGIDTDGGGRLTADPLDGSQPQLKAKVVETPIAPPTIAVSSSTTSRRAALSTSISVSMQW